MDGTELDGVESYFAGQLHSAEIVSIVLLSISQSVWFDYSEICQP